MLLAAAQNVMIFHTKYASPMRDKFGRRTGGLRTDGSELGSWPSHAQIGRAPRLISGVSFSLRFASERVVVVLLFAVFAVLRFRHIWPANPFLNYVPLTLETSAPARPVLLIFMIVLSLSRQLYAFS